MGLSPWEEQLHAIYSQFFLNRVQTQALKW